MNSGNKSGKNDKKREGYKFISGFFSLSLSGSLARFSGLGARATFQGRDKLRVFFERGEKRRAKKGSKTERGNFFFKEKEAPACLVLLLSLPPAPSLPSLSLHLSHRVLAGPLARRLLVPRPVGLVDVRDLRHERVVRVRVAQQRADREEHLGQSERRGPLLLEDVEADRALRVDVGVVDLVVLGVGVFYFIRGEKAGGEQERSKMNKTSKKKERHRNEKNITLVWNWTLGGLKG